MQYMGGKARIGAHLERAILSATSRRRVYLEPFVGAGWMLYRMAPHFAEVHAGEVSPDLVALYRALRAGWVPPESVSPEEYKALRATEAPSALRTFAGYGCSFGGKWFGGYARNGRGDDFCGAARRGLERKMPWLGQVEQKDYRLWSPRADWVVYCDPPYRDTTAYSAAFDSATFWRTMEQWADVGAHVFVSEYTHGSSRAEEVWRRSVKQSLRRDSNVEPATERLFRISR